MYRLREMSLLKSFYSESMAAFRTENLHYTVLRISIITLTGKCFI